jgi:hypothetical protein
MKIPGFLLFATGLALVTMESIVIGLVCGFLGFILAKSQK